MSETRVHISEKLRQLAERLRESGLDWGGASVCEEGAEMIEAQGLVISDLEQDANARIGPREPAPEQEIEAGGFKVKRFSIADLERDPERFEIRPDGEIVLKLASRARAPGVPSEAAIEAAAQAYGEQWGDPPWDDLPEAEQEATRLILGVILRVAYAVDGAASSDDRALRERVEHIVDGWAKWLVKHGPNRVSVAPMMQSCLDELREALAGAAPSAPPQ